MGKKIVFPLLIRLWGLGEPENRPKWFYCNLISADRFCWQQMTDNSSPFYHEKWGYCTSQFIKRGYRYFSYPRKLRLWLRFLTNCATRAVLSSREPWTTRRACLYLMPSGATCPMWFNSEREGARIRYDLRVVVEPVQVNIYATQADK